MDKINLSIDEAAFFLGYKKSYLYRLTASQKIPFSKPNNGKIFFDKEKLEEWVLRNNERKENKKTDLNATVFSTIMNAMKIINLSEKNQPMPNILFEFPIDQIIERLREVVREELSQASGTAANTGNSSEPPITTKELCKFLNITEPTAIRYRKLGKIPFFEIGSAIRYSKKEVMDALRNDTKIKAKN